MKLVPSFCCLECGHKFYSAKAAERAFNSNDGCPGCGGSDIDIYRSAAELDDRSDNEKALGDPIYG